MEKLIKIQSELKAPKGNFNSFGKYKYRSAEDILEAVKPLLLKHDVLLTLNDSIESYEYYDVCSPKCYKDKMRQILEGKYKNRKWATIDEKDIQFARLLVESFK